MLPKEVVSEEKRVPEIAKSEDWTKDPGSKGRYWSSERCVETNARGCLGQPVRSSKVKALNLLDLG